MEGAAGLQDGQVVPVRSLNWDGLKPWDCGLWSETEPPVELRDCLHEPQHYLQAIHHINKIHRKKVRYRSDTAQALITICMVLGAILGTAAGIMGMALHGDGITIVSTIVALLSYYYSALTFRKREAKRIFKLLLKAVSKANVQLRHEDVLISCLSHVELLVTRVPLSGCRGRLGGRYNSALSTYSCVYVCNLALGPMESIPEEDGHLRGRLCFCQFVQKKMCCGCFC